MASGRGEEVCVRHAGAEQFLRVSVRCFAIADGHVGAAVERQPKQLQWSADAQLVLEKKGLPDDLAQVDERGALALEKVGGNEVRRDPAGESLPVTAEVYRADECCGRCSLDGV